MRTCPTCRGKHDGALVANGDFTLRNIIAMHRLCEVCGLVVVTAKPHICAERVVKVRRSKGHFKTFEVSNVSATGRVSTRRYGAAELSEVVPSHIFLPGGDEFFPIIL